MITLRQLHYALHVEKTLHFKKAAEACHISQSALSTALTELEKQLGLQIFERDNKKVLITPAGRQVLDIARGIQQQVETLENLASSQQAPLSFPMHIGVIPTIAPYLLPAIFPTLNRQYPDAQIHIVEQQSAILVDLVRRGEIDTAIIALPYDCGGLLSMKFWEEDFYWITLKKNLSRGQKSVAAKDVNEGELLLLNEGHCLKDHILSACRISGELNRNKLGSASLTTLVQMVLGGMGSTLIPAMARDSLIGKHPELSALHLNEPGPHRQIAFIFRPNYSRLSSIEALIKICKASLSAQRK